MNIQEEDNADPANSIKNLHNGLLDNMLNAFAYCRMDFTDGKPDDFTYLKVNRAFKTLTGLKNVEGKKVGEVIPGLVISDRELIELFGRVALSGKPEKLEYHLKALDMWVSMSVYSPEKEYFVTIFDVITVNKQTENELIKAKESAEANNANVTAIIEGIEESMWAFDRNFDILYINNVFQKEFYQTFGKKLKPGVSLIQSLPEVLRPVWQPRYERVLSNERFTIEDAIDTGNDTIYIQISFNPIIQNGNVIGGSCIGSNITNRKLAELELIKDKEEAEEREFFLNESQKVGMIGSYKTDFTSGYWKSSETLDKIFGIRLDYDRTVPGWLDLVHPDDKNMINTHLSEEVIGKRKPFDKEYRIIRKNDNQVRWVLGQGLTDIDDKGTVVSLVGTIQDITERKKIEEELLFAKEKAEESDRLKSAFLANMSHEIRTPMNGIMGFTSLLKEPGLNGEQQKQFIKIIEKSGARMLNILNEIIDIAKIESGQMGLNNSNININEHIEQVYNLLKPAAEDKNINISINNGLAPDKANIKTDSEKLNSILTNLVKNAVKYTSRGSIEFGYIKKGNWLEFYVEDTGDGIPADRQEAIFERFIQADVSDINAQQGAGLGLSISKAFVDMLGGKIWVVSEPGKGSKFYFTLPYNIVNKENAVIVNSISPPAVKIEVGKLKILITEDDEVSELLFSLIVKDISKEILNARTGNEAVEICKNNPDIDLILMDIQMPGLNGFEATREIRQFNQDVIIIAETAFALTGDRERAMDSGCNDYISKPIEKVELFSLIEKYFKNGKDS